MIFDVRYSRLTSRYFLYLRADTRDACGERAAFEVEARFGILKPNVIHT